MILKNSTNKILFTLLVITLPLCNNYTIAQVTDPVSETKNGNNNEELYKQYISKADKFYKSKKYTQAQEYYKKALEIKPESKYPKYKLQDIKTINELFAILDAIDIIMPDLKIKELVKAKPIKQEQIVKSDEPLIIDNKLEIKEETKTVTPLVLKKQEPEVIEVIEVEPIPEEVIEEVIIKEVVEEIVEEQPVPVKTEKPKVVKKSTPEKPKPTIKDEEEEKARLAKKYTILKTVEQIDSKTKKVTRIIINKDGKVSVYLKVVHNWGGVYYFIDHTPLANQSITQELYQRSTNIEE